MSKWSCFSLRRCCWLSQRLRIRCWVSWRLLGPLLARREGVLASGLARIILRFAWHVTSVTWAVLALILVQLVRDPATARFWAAAGTGVAFAGMGLFDAISTRGRHVGWPLLTAIGIGALLSLR